MGPVGAQEKIGIDRSKVTQPSLCLGDLFKMNESFRSTVESRPLPHPTKQKQFMKSQKKNKIMVFYPNGCPKRNWTKCLGSGSGMVFLDLPYGNKKSIA